MFIYFWPSGLFFFCWPDRPAGLVALLTQLIVQARPLCTGPFLPGLGPRLFPCSWAATIASPSGSSSSTFARLGPSGLASPQQHSCSPSPSLLLTPGPHASASLPPCLSRRRTPPIGGAARNNAISSPCLIGLDSSLYIKVVRRAPPSFSIYSLH